MNLTLTDGTTVRSTPAGLLATRGKREIHFLGTSAAATARATALLAQNSFDSLFKAASRGPKAMGSNVRIVRTR